MIDQSGPKPDQMTNQSQSQPIPASLNGTIIPNQRYKGGRNSDLDQLWLDYARLYMDNWQNDGAQVPTIAGLCLATQISDVTYHAWVNKLTDPSYDCNDVESQFLSIACKLHLLQQNGLIQGGLAGKFQPTITKLLLGKHGYSDKIEAELTARHGVSGNIADLEPQDAATAYLDLIASPA